MSVFGIEIGDIFGGDDSGLDDTQRSMLEDPEIQEYIEDEIREFIIEALLGLL